MLMRAPRSHTGKTQIIIDATHLGKRHITGIERITLDLFSEQALKAFTVKTVTAKNRFHMIWQQNVTLPIMAIKNRDAIILTPGFPPSFLLSLFCARVIPYIHDLFLVTRWQDLSFIGRYYMSGPFRFAIRNLPLFFVNSESTRAELRSQCRNNAEITLYRPPARNIFSLEPKLSRKFDSAQGTLKLVALGTVEPRKNLSAAADIVENLRKGAFPNASLDIIGRTGWGNEIDKLKNRSGITLHGYKSGPEIKTILESADFLISTSQDEGLGLPLLEAQYAGLAIIAPDRQIFREVLDQSGIFINPLDINASVAVITNEVHRQNWQEERSRGAVKNLQRWNNLAMCDHLMITAVLGSMTNSKPIR